MKSRYRVALALGALALLVPSSHSGNSAGKPLTKKEAAAVESLRALWFAQEFARAHVAIDPDVDGIGGYGTLGELAGSVAVRGSWNTIHDAIGAFPFSPYLGNVDGNGYGRCGAYFFAVYLPTAGGNPLAEVAGGGADPAIDEDLSESYWIAYAWPVKYGGQKRRAFVVDQTGEILFTEGSVVRYDGTLTSPWGSSALTWSDSMVDGIVDGVACDGNTWEAVGTLPLY